MFRNSDVSLRGEELLGRAKLDVFGCGSNMRAEVLLFVRSYGRAACKVASRTGDMTKYKGIRTTLALLERVVRVAVTVMSLLSVHVNVICSIPSHAYEFAK